MNCNLNGGRIYKGSIAQIDVFLYPACATGISGLAVNFYTVSGTSVEKTASDFVISGGVGTVVFQPVELEVFEDGVLRYNVSYELDGEPIVEDLETRWYIKTPIPHTPIDFVTTGNVTEIVMEAISGSGITIEIQEQIDASITGKADTTAVTQSLATKQDNLVSGTNIKTVNSQSLLGSGNIVITSATPTQYTAGANIAIQDYVISVTGITVPTSNTALTNDAGYITESAIPTSNTAFTNDAGYITGVTSQQIISALGYTPCRVTAITQSEYTQLQNKDANTIYGITD